MRPVGEALGVRIEKQNRQRDGRQLQPQRVQLPRGEDKHRDCGERENPGEAGGESASCERSLRGAWSFQVGQPWRANLAASNAPVSAKGSANTECSNLIISSTVRRRVMHVIGMWVSTQRTQSSRRRGTLVRRRLALRSCFGFFRRG